jgi:hypothetical protein
MSAIKTQNYVQGTGTSERWGGGKEVPPKFVQGYKPFVYKPNDQYCVYIGPTSATDAVLYMTDSRGNAVPISDKIEIFSFDICDYVNIPKNVVYFPMFLSTSYTIRFEGEIFLSGLIDYPLSKRFKTQQQETEELMQRYTVLITGDVVKDSAIIKLSSTHGLVTGRAISGQGIPDCSIIVEVDHETKCVTIDEPCTEDASRTFIQVQ